MTFARAFVWALVAAKALLALALMMAPELFLPALHDLMRG